MQPRYSQPVADTERQHSGRESAAPAPQHLPGGHTAQQPSQQPAAGWRTGLDASVPRTSARSVHRVCAGDTGHSPCGASHLSKIGKGN